jgi:hypothetical protein
MQLKTLVALSLLCLEQSCKPKAAPAIAHVKSSSILQIGVVGALLNQKTGRHVWIECKIDQPLGTVLNAEPSVIIAALKVDFESRYNAYNNQDSKRPISIEQLLAPTKNCKPMSVEGSVSDIPEFLTSRLGAAPTAAQPGRSVVRPMQSTNGISQGLAVFLLALTPCTANTPVADGNGTVALSKLPIPGLTDCSPEKMNILLDYIVDKGARTQGSLGEANFHREYVKALGAQTQPIVAAPTNYLQLKENLILPYAKFLEALQNQQAANFPAQNGTNANCSLPDRSMIGMNWQRLAPCLINRSANIGKSEKGENRTGQISAYSGRYGLFFDKRAFGIPWVKLSSFNLLDASGNPIVNQPIHAAPNPPQRMNQNQYDQDIPDQGESSPDQ